MNSIGDKDKYSLSIGTIATGAKGNEPIMSLENFERDILFAKNNGFSRVIIFRLGGLNKKHVQIINKIR